MEHKVKKYIAVLIGIWILTMITLFGLTYFTQEKINDDYKADNIEMIHPEVPIIHDDIVLKETKMYCPLCGNETTAINGEIVCRNVKCDDYGVPVHVSKCDDYMNENSEDYLEEEK